MKKYLFLFSLFLVSFSLSAQNPAAISVLFDISRSVPAAEFEKAKQSIAELIRQSPPDSISVYTFGTELKKIDLADLKDLRPDASSTMMFDAIYDVAVKLSKTDASRKAMIIISDGLDTISATVLEDTVTFANDNHITIYGIGVGKVNRKTIERMVRLTGGKFYNWQDPTIASDLGSAISRQQVPQKEAAPQPAKSSPAVQPARQGSPVVAPPQPQPQGGASFGWILWLAGAAVLLVALTLLIVRVFKEPKRACPTCGKILEGYQTICPDCSSARGAKKLSPSDTQEIVVSEESAEEHPIPPELLEKRPVTEEMLSKTFVLMEKPMLVVRKGKNLGQTFSLNRSFPVSIGRSRVNEVRVDDVTVSGQHCRIIPENGKHVLYDLGSTNGTFINDMKVKRAVLKQGDVVKVGETQFLYKIELQRN